MFRKFKRTISFLLISAMMLTMVPEIPAYAEGNRGANLVPTIESNGQVTFYYKDEGASSVYVQGSWDSSWKKFFHMTKSENGFWSVTSEGLDPGTSYEYGIMVDGQWLSPQPNAPLLNGKPNGNPRIIRNPNVNLDGTVTFYYYPSMGENASDIKVKYKGQDGVENEVGFAPDGTYTTIYSATTEPLNGTYDYYISVSESASVSGGDLYGYNSNTSTFTVVGDVPKENPEIKSPVIDKGNVTFNYYAPLAKEIKLAGSMTDWGNGALTMDYNSATGYWSITLTEQRSGEYQYKFVEGTEWIQDPLNQNPNGDNSVYTVTDGFVPELVSPVVDTSQVTFSYKGAPEDNVVLIGSMNGWQRDGVDADKMTNYDEKTGVWSITKRLAPKEYEYKFCVNGTDINDPLNIEPLKNTNSVVTVQDYYTYNIYYYDTKHTELEDTSLWIWEEGGAGGIQYLYSSKEVIDDFTWLKAEVDLSYTKLSVIPKSYTEWSWQDSTRVYEFTGDNQQEDIYIIFGDPTIYTECPDLSAIELPKDRYIMIDYTRDNGDYADWNVYTWNSGYGGDVSVPFEEVNGRWIATIPVTPATSTLNFCVRRSPVGGNAWAEKDGGDHAVTIGDKQIVTKAKMTQGIGVEETLPNNIGFEIKPNDNKVMFYYRDDNRFLTNTQEELKGKVQIGIDMPDTDAFASTFANSQLVDMTYDEKNERFQYEHQSLTNGEHTYYYMIDGERVLDLFNSRVNADGDANIYEYYTFDADFTSKLVYPTMDYNDNNLLSVTMNNPTGAADALEVVEAYADLSQLGGGITAISPELMELSISVLHTTSPGTKVIPVVVKDQYGNEYKTETTVEVKAKSSDDFDWDEAIIYFTLTDRFYDGNSGNNDAYGIGDYNTGELGGSSYHGGDFAGLTQKLDYLKEMGVNTIWITPIVENDVEVTVDGTNIKSYGYHGYWASDFEKLNKHLGTEEELSTLVKELHNRDMKLMVDVVLNHTGYDTNGNNITDFFNNKLNGKKMLRDSTNTVPKHDVLDALSGLPDFVTEDAEVRDLLIEWQTSWVSKYDIDYFRVDTVKHVEDTTWAAFKNALVKIDPDFKMIGEQSGAGYATTAGKLGNGLMDSLLDFDFNDKALDFVTGKMSEIESFMQGRNAGIDNTATMGSFLGSHDEDGFLYRLQEERNMSPEDSYDAMKLAASLQITAKGQPVIYYGEEVGQTGANNYPIQDNRYDFDWSLVNDENTMLTHYKTLLDIRGEYSDVFAKGNRTSVAVSDEKGYDIFQRSYEDSTVIVALQSGEEQQKVTIKAGGAGDTLKDIYNDTNYTVGADGKVEIKIPSIADGGTAVLELVKKEAEKPSEEKPTEEKPSEEKPGTGESGTQKPKPGDSNQNNNNQNNSNQEVKASVEESNDKKSPVTYDFSDPQNSKNMLITMLIMVVAISCATGVTTYLSYRSKETEE